MQVKRFGLQVLGMLKRIRQMDARKIFRKSDRFLFFDENFSFFLKLKKVNFIINYSYLDKLIK